MGITCHWIDNEWKIQKRIIAFRVFDDRHTAENIFRIIQNILQEYSLVKKVFSIGFDNAAANTASIVELKNICQPNIGGKFFHIRCVCHVLNLCVQDGLRSLDVCLQPIKKAIAFLWTHPQVMKLWAKFCRENGKKPKRFSRDVPTRWNSTYELLNESFSYKELLCMFINNNVPQVNLFPQNWEVCQKILDLLKVFNDATYTLSGVYYPTSHLLLIECINIVGAMQENETDLILSESILIMKNKWLNYFKMIPLINLVACVFDPRIKIDGLTDYLRMYYECLHIDESEINIDNIINDVRKILGELYNEYKMQYGDVLSSSQPTCQVQSVATGKLSMGDRILLERQKKPRGSTGAPELDIYLTTAFEFGDSKTGKEFPVIEWWSRHQNTYPILAKIAKQILACPVSTVAVEQAFSAGGNILDETRSNMTPESLEVQACVDDWTKAAIRDQEFKRDDDDDEFVEMTTTGTEGTSTPGIGSD